MNTVVRVKRKAYALLGTILCVGALALLPGIARADNWALLIGIDQYEDANRINSLGAAGADAKALAKTLKETAGFTEDHIQLLTSDGALKPTRSNIITALTRLAKNAQPGDTVFVLYSGHGVEIAGTPYLLPFDTAALDDDSLTDSALAVSKFRQRLAQIKAKALILAFDMCRSDPRKSGKDVAVSDNKLSQDMARGLDFKKSSSGSGADNVSAISPIAITLYSCSPDQRSYEWAEKGRGYFSYYLEQGLRGKAADSNGKVTVLSLAQYVGKEVKAAVDREESKSQTPYPSLDGPGAESFVLASGAPNGNSDTVAGKGTEIDTKVRLSVTVNVSDAVVTVAGIPTQDGKFAANLLDEKEKEVEVKVTAKGYEGKLLKVTLQRGKAITLPVTLEAIAAPPISIVSGEGKAAANELLSLVPGLLEEAKKTAEDTPYSKGLVLCKVAVAQSKTGDISGAKANISSARSSAESISDALVKSELLSNIAMAQIEVGDIDEARLTAESISKVTFKSSALCAIAVAQAKAGDINGAKSTISSAKSRAESIPKASYKPPVLSEIAVAQVNIGDISAAKATISSARSTAESISDYIGKYSGLCVIAVAQAKAGDINGAKSTISSAKSRAESIPDEYEKYFVLSEIAVAQANIGDISGAKTTAESIRNYTPRYSALYVIAVTQAKAQAEAGDVTGAKSTVENYSDHSGRWLVLEALTLRAIAVYQAKMGDISQAKLTAGSISRGFDRSITLIDMALAIIEVAKAKK